VVNPRPASICRKAAMRYARKRAGSLSCSSRDSHATGHVTLCNHSVASVVLPYPAEAQTTVSLWPARNPRSRRSMSCGRGTKLGRRTGISSLVASNVDKEDTDHTGPSASKARLQHEVDDRVVLL